MHLRRSLYYLHLILISQTHRSTMHCTVNPTSNGANRPANNESHC